MYFVFLCFYKTEINRTNKKKSLTVSNYFRVKNSKVSQTLRVTKLYINF